MVSKPLSDTRPYQEKQNEQARDSGSTDNPGNNRENEGLLMMAEFEREIAAQGGGGGVPPLPPKKNSRGSSIGDLLASVAKSAVNVVQDFEQNPTPPSRYVVFTSTVRPIGCYGRSFNSPFLPLYYFFVSLSTVSMAGFQSTCRQLRVNLQTLLLGCLAILLLIGLTSTSRQTCQQ